MAQTIKLKRSSVSGNTPGTSDLELGEVAINTYDGKMFIKKNDGSDSIVEIGGSSGTVTEAFKTIAVSGQSSVVADSATDTLTLVAGSNMTITTNQAGDTVTFASSGGGGTQNVFSTFAVSGQNNVVADSSTDTLTFVAGSGITLTTDNSADSITIAATASAITVQDEGSALSTSATTLNFVGAGVTATGTGATKTITIPGTGTVSEAFKTIAVSGQNNVVADAATDTLTLVAGSNMTITTDQSGDSITFASSGGGGGSQNVFSNIGVSGQGTIQADSTTDTLTFEAGTGISLATDTTNDKLTITATGGATSVANAASSIKEFKYDISSSTTTITGSDANSNTLAYEAGAIQVFLNGILLDPATDYTASNGTSVVLTDAAVSGDDVQIVSFNRKIVTANVGIDTFTGDSSGTRVFTLSSDPVNKNNTRVMIDGVYQAKSSYSISGTTLTFGTGASDAPPDGSAIEVEVGFTQAEIGSTLDFADNAILRIGTGNDLQILHDGSNSIIKDTGTGALIIGGSEVSLQNSGLNEYMVRALEDGAVELYFDNSKKLETVTGGVTITGTVTATTFSGDLSGTINTATTGATQSASDNSTKLATTAYVTTALSNLVDSAPGTLNTLNELAAALGDDANFSTTITGQLATKVGLTATTGAANMPAGTTAQRPGSPAAGQFRYNSTLSQFEGYTSSWGAIGGGGTNTFTTDTLTTSGSATMTLSQAVSSPNDCIVHIDGIYQTPTDAYTVSGTTLTFTATPASGRKVVVYSVRAGVSGNNLNVQSINGDGINHTFTLNVNPINENNTIVHIDGVYQQKSSYSVSGTQLTFGAGNIPANNTVIEVATFTQTEINVPVNDTIDTVHIKDDAVTSAKLGGNLVAPGTVTASAGFVGPLTGNVTGNVSGTAATVTTAAQPNITSVGTLTGLTVSSAISAEDNIYLTDAGTIRGKLLLNASDRDNVELRAESLGSTMKFFTVGTEALLLDASQNATFAGSVTATGTSVFANLDISGDVDIDGTTNLDVVDIDGAVDMASTLTVGGATRINADFSVSAASGEDRFAILPQSAGSGSILMSGNAGLTGYEPLTVDFESLALRTSGVERFAVLTNGNVALGKDLATTTVSKTFSTGHASANRGKNVRYGLDDGAFSGIEIVNAASAVSSYNSQSINFITHEGAVSTATRMTIDSLGRVGIGVNPSNPLSVLGASGTIASFTNGADADLLIKAQSGVTTLTPTTGTLAFGTSSTERWRIDSGGALTGTRAAVGKIIGENIHWNGSNYSNINTSYGAAFFQITDNGSLYYRKTSAGSGSQSASYVFSVNSSGNLLVGTLNTGANHASNGAYITPAGQLVGRATGIVSYLNRRGSNGQILQFMKDGAYVGSIGVDAGDNIYFAGGSGNTKGIYINEAAVYPGNTGGGVIDNAVDLGQSGYRWKDLYLSGGVYVGGTGSANKLEDYEEGNWTPTYVPSSAAFSSIAYDGQIGGYTKVGDTVHAWFYLRTSSVSGGSGTLTIDGLPFSPNKNTYLGVGTIVAQDQWTGAAPQGCFVDSGATITLQRMTDTGTSYLTISPSNMQNGSNKNRIYGYVIYQTTS